MAQWCMQPIYTKLFICYWLIEHWLNCELNLVVYFLSHVSYFFCLILCFDLCSVINVNHCAEVWTRLLSHGITNYLPCDHSKQHTPIGHEVIFKCDAITKIVLMKGYCPISYFKLVSILIHKCVSHLSTLAILNMQVSQILISFLGDLSSDTYTNMWCL